ncbi:flavodoxin family protein [Sphingobacterium hungaricum]|uniref:Dialkylresorcinol condensing enzyme DarA n=1 Tax=Sphingobacterium hungaricum TaxID=2082723 RepID=A0A928YQF5_9SPHI|nr:flavodoxin family protein [Sphingobacterium hungaricum]MBE8713909.1 dialkylresorcinol condensing enzyme DarA [Sphingobacterium hungaricum]
MKKVLVVYYTQSGQLLEIAQQIAKPFIEDDAFQLDYHQIKMKNDFPFPWNGDEFFDTFPETFKQIPQELQPVNPEILSTDYDLILFHYQVWYLTPSIPINSFLKSEEAKQILSGKPVVTISGSRNMWAYAQEKMKVLLKENEASLVGNIALTDRHNNLISVITIVDWLFSGIKKRAFGIFPLPGVAQEEIESSDKFGKIIKSYLKNGNFIGMQEELVANGAVEFKFFLVSMDQKGNRMFNIWSNLILSNPKKRKLLVQLFKYYVICAIYILSPIVNIIELILYPLLWVLKIKRQKKYFQGV